MFGCVSMCCEAWLDWWRGVVRRCGVSQEKAEENEVRSNQTNSRRKQNQKGERTRRKRERRELGNEVEGPEHSC